MGTISLLRLACVGPDRFHHVEFGQREEILPEENKKRTAISSSSSSSSAHAPPSFLCLCLRPVRVTSMVCICARLRLAFQAGGSVATRLNS